MPLSSNGLCDAEMTMPASKPSALVRYATAGVGMTPAVVTRAAAEPAPRASSRSIQAPDSRVSRPTSSRTCRPVAPTTRPRPRRCARWSADPAGTRPPGRARHPFQTTAGPCSTVPHRTLDLDARRFGAQHVEDFPRDPTSQAACIDRARAAPLPRTPRSRFRRDRRRHRAGRARRRRQRCGVRLVRFNFSSSRTRTVTLRTIRSIGAGITSNGDDGGPRLAQPQRRVGDAQSSRCRGRRRARRRSRPARWSLRERLEMALGPDHFHGGRIGGHFPP